jgi:UTP--glucose-1-phosphate uridylyltransferase
MTHGISADFAPFEQRMRQEGLPDIVIDNFKHYYETLAAGSMGLIGEDEIDPVDSVPDIAEVAAYTDAGREAIKRTVVLKLNGGLGTSMGLDQAKSLLIVRDQLMFLDIIARQNIHTSARYRRHIPLVLMNSFNTDADSRAVLAGYPDLQSDIPLTVMQHKIPKVLQGTRGPAEWPSNPELEWCPPGHGEVYVVLTTSGMLDTLLDHGYEHLFIANVDNLGATLDLGIVGYIAHHGIPFLMEVADRTEADKKGGHIARRKDGQLILREVAQCPAADLPAFQDIRKHRYFNTNNIWVSLSRLKQILGANNNVLKLPMIRNAKTIDPKDSGSPAVFQLETAMGAAIAVFPGAQVLRVTRDRFMPVKTCEDLLRLRSDIYTLGDDYVLRVNPARRIETTAIELDPRYYQRIDDFEARFPRQVPSLLDCTRLAVQGDVAFDPGIVFKGAIQIVNGADEQRRLPAGAVLADARCDLTEAKQN